MSWREGCTSGERKGERRGRDLHEERRGNHRSGGGVRQAEGGREAQREGQNSGEGGDQEGGSVLSHLPIVPLESPLLYGETELRTK